MEHGKTLTALLMLILVLTIVVVKLFSSGTTVFSVSAIETVNHIGVYWDADCSSRVYSIDWGVLSPGGVKKVIVYVRNEGNESSILVLTPENWNPMDASRYLNFSWSCEGDWVDVGEVVEVTQSLFVSPYIREITDFGFDIVFEGRNYFLGDVNKDKIVDIRDLTIIASAYGTTCEDSGWNPDADLNNDGVINVLDIVLVFKDFGKSS